MSSFVYVIRAGDNGPIKIGMTDNVAARWKQLQSSNALPLSVEAAFPFSDRERARKIERALHASFSPGRLIGEWFRPDSQAGHFLSGIRSMTDSHRARLVEQLDMWARQDLGITVCPSCHSAVDDRAPGSRCYERSRLHRDCLCIGILVFKTFDELDAELQEREQEEYLRDLAKYERQWD